MTEGKEIEPAEESAYSKVEEQFRQKQDSRAAGKPHGKAETEMKDQRTRLVIQGNELYEIDLDCVRKRQEGKPCQEEKQPVREEKQKNTKQNP